MWRRSSQESCWLALRFLLACFAQRVSADGSSHPRELQGTLYQSPGTVVYKCTIESGCESCGHFDCNLLIPILCPVILLIILAVLFWCCFFRLGPRERALIQVSHGCVAAQHERYFTTGLVCTKCDMCQQEFGKENKLEYCPKCEVTICMVQCRKPIAVLCRQNLHVRYRTTGPHKGLDFKKFTCDICRVRYSKMCDFERCDRCRVNICNSCGDGKKKYVDIPIHNLKLRTPIAPGFRFHYFLSYKKQHATLGLQPETFVQDLHVGLAKGGLCGFYNQKSTKTARLEKVSECSVVIICLNDETLTSSACQQELQFAAWEGPPIVVVYDNDNYQEDALRKHYSTAVAITSLPWIGFSKATWQASMQQLGDWVAIFSDLTKAAKSDVDKYAKLPFETRHEVSKKAEDQAAAEGLTLVRSNRWDSKFVGVTRDINGGFEARGKDERMKDSILGRFRTAEEAALTFARSIGPEGSAALNKMESAEWQRSMREAADERQAATAGNGLNMPGAGFSLY
eukprot:TRINITY_DN21763_c0_g1_i1.p1 TRINITY_DN21763_c0_g1~~TRINITY_DN21763_c0_g1_i1.p1  ORF type:complete len:542 (+),score=63.25 TRINITY_DN21763_c0_g1_i1:91-1626(+)